MREEKSGRLVTAYARAVSACKLLAPLLASWEGRGTPASIKSGPQITSSANVILPNETLTWTGTWTTIYKGDNKQWLVCDIAFINTVNFILMFSAVHL